MELTNVLFIASISSGILIFLLSAISYFSDILNFWPPKSKKTWQFKLFWGLFCFFSFPLFIIIFLNYENHNSNIWLFIIGLFFSLAGLILANFISFKLGVKNTSGQKEALKTNGWYSISRNPIYVTTIFSLIGTMIAFPIYQVTLISLLWILIYILAPFTEEPWLEEQYGNAYLEYKAKTRRFL